MKLQQVNKLYDKLTPQEQAALVFEAALQSSESEVDLILDSVERKDYRALHIDYQIRIRGLTNLAGLFGIYYWRALFQLAFVMAKTKDSDNFAEVSKQYRDEFAAINEALTIVCDALNIETETVKQYSECFQYTPAFGGKPEIQLIDKYSNLFTQFAYLDDHK